MALGDVTIFKDGAFSPIGARRYRVAKSGTTIKAGEPVNKGIISTVAAAGTNVATVVIPAITNSPNVGTSYIIGIAQSTSTNTASLEGIVDVLPCVPGVIYLCAPLTSTLFDTQAEYDALVGRKVCFDLTSSTYTITTTTTTGGNASAPGNGLVVEPLEIAKYPGKVAFSVRNSVIYNN